MQKTIPLIDRKTKKRVEEKVFVPELLHFLYRKKGIFSQLALYIVRIPFYSYLFGLLQKRKRSRKKILPFIEMFAIDTDEMEKKVEEFSSFNDFFIRKIHLSCRPFSQVSDEAILPCDGRYLAFENFDTATSFYVKGKKFTLEKLLQSKELAEQYQNGSIVIGRLAPSDYHRIHFPIDAVPSIPKKIPGYLYSVNPVALKTNIDYLTQNKRVITPLFSETFGEVLLIEIGATIVGTIHQSFTPNRSYKKGEEKGYFSFGGSCVILLFEKGRIELAKDLLENTENGIETLSKMGEPLGKAVL